MEIKTDYSSNNEQKASVLYRENSGLNVNGPRRGSQVVKA
jgi:hypothetical protein